MNNKYFYIRSRWGKKLLIVNNYSFCANKRIHSTNTTYWRCTLANHKKLNPCSARCTTKEKNIDDDIMYINSIKGGLQLCYQGFPFTRHRVRGDTIYWRCVQFHPLGCKARLRTRNNGKKLEIVSYKHNHKILKERRKKGSLKIVYEERKKLKSKTNVKKK